jgi:phospholipid/cholesterol/gamma-HCH transport system substrate-binding protein
VRTAVAPVKSFRERRPWLVGSIGLLLIAAGVAGAFSINKLPQLRGVYEISAELQDAAGLQSGNEVRAAGVRIGRVTGIELTPTSARIDMEIEDHVKIPVETRVEIKLKTLLGQKFVDLQLPRTYVEAASRGRDPDVTTEGYLADGAVIPRSQTSVPYEIYQAANAGTEILSKIDKHALRRLLVVTGNVVGASKDELRAALTGIDRAGTVLRRNGESISVLLRNANRLSGVLARNDRNLDGIFRRASEVLGTLADKRARISSLLGATNSLTRDLGLLIRGARGSLRTGSADLASVLTAVEKELGSLDAALAELPVSGRLFARPTFFGRFIEGTVCAVTVEDTCIPEGSPQNPGLPIAGIQPSPDARSHGAGGGMQP